MRASTVIRMAIFGVMIQGFVSAGSAQSTQCSDCDRTADVGVLVFGGVLADGDFPGRANIPFSGPEEDFIGCAAVGRDLVDLGMGFHFGGEVGLAGRFGDRSSAEFWGGPSLRHDGLDIGPVAISVGMAVGLSFVTDPTGSERAAELDNGGDATLLYYAGPEVGISFDAIPNTEFVFQIHHRSGGRDVPFLPTLGDMPNASNAHILGVRRRF
jgi:hypothetical protein